MRKEWPIETDRVARHRVGSGYHDDEMIEMWEAKRDSLDMARALSVHESLIVKRAPWRHT